jgi:hypothetical protein
MRSSKPELASQLSPADAVASACTPEIPVPFNVKFGGYTVAEFHQTLTPKGCDAIPVRIVAIPTAAVVAGHHTQTLCADEDGVYYSVEWRSAEDAGGSAPLSIVRRLTPREAMQWVIGQYVTNADAHMLKELRRAVENPEFDFMPLVARGKRRTRGRRRQAPASGPFAVQLEMATAFVECVRKLDADPSIVHLADACRAASALHQAIHAPENFKTAGAL